MEKMRKLQSRSGFVISTLFSNEGVQTPLYMYERCVSFEKGREPVTYPKP